MKLVKPDIILKRAGFASALLLSTSFIFSQSITQSKPATKAYKASKTEIRPLNIGDRVPDFEFSLVNHPRKKARLSDFSGKYILLDYWATWCSSCLHNFPTLDSLQKKYSDKLQVLLVNTKDTRDDENKLTAFFAKWKNRSGEKYSLPTIVYDTISSQFFPHRGVPHYVWVDKNGVVQGITESAYVTTKNIESFIFGNKLNFPIRKKLEYDFTKPLFINGNGGGNENYTYRSLLTGYLDGLAGSGGTFSNNDGKVIRLSNINTSVLNLYMQAYDELGLSPENRIMLNVRNPLKYHKKGSWDNWKNQYCVTYELILPPCSKEEAKKVMQDDLKRYFGLTVKKEKIMTKCLVLKKGEIPESIIAHGGKSETNIFEEDNSPKYLHNYPIFGLIRYLNNTLDLPVIDETKFERKINIELPADLLNIKMLQQALKKYGFDLLEETRELEFFILSEKGL